MADPKRISKSLSYWLRHKPAAGNLVLDAQGWAQLPDVLAALGAAGLPATLEALQVIVAESDKQRFELSPDGAFIRARQGHSVPVDLGWPITVPPDFLFHGTVERFLGVIFSEGLKPMKRHHVHLSPDAETANAVGARRGEAVILSVAAGRMAADGHVFRLSGNGVWLADHVPPTYLSRRGD